MEKVTGDYNEINLFLDYRVDSILERLYVEFSESLVPPGADVTVCEVSEAGYVKALLQSLCVSKASNQLLD